MHRNFDQKLEGDMEQGDTGKQTDFEYSALGRRTASQGKGSLTCAGTSVILSVYDH